MDVGAYVAHDLAHPVGAGVADPRANAGLPVGRHGASLLVRASARARATGAEHMPRWMSAYRGAPSRSSVLKVRRFMAGSWMPARVRALARASRAARASWTFSAGSGVAAWAGWLAVELAVELGVVGVVVMRGSLSVCGPLGGCLGGVGWITLRASGVTTRCPGVGPAGAVDGPCFLTGCTWRHTFHTVHVRLWRGAVCRSDV